MAGTIMPAPWFTGLDDNGVTVIGGKLYTYAAGTSTPLATFTDVDLQVANSNPVILDGGGRATVYLSATSYKFVLTDANDVTIRTQDNIAANAAFSVDLDISGVAGENLSVGQVVYLSVGLGGTIAGRWYLTDADFDYASADASVVGIVATPAAPAGAVVRVRLQGRSTVPGPLTVGLPYYASTTAGALVTPAPILPAFVRAIGIADSITTVVTASGFGGGSVITGDASISGNLSVTGQTTLGQDLVFTGDYSIRRNTTDTADTGRLTFGGGGGPFVPNGPNQTRGGFVAVFGNEFVGGPAGNVVLAAGDTATGSGQIQFYTGTPFGTLRGAMHKSGGFSWGDAVDPGPGSLSVAGTLSSPTALISDLVVTGLAEFHNIVEMFDPVNMHGQLSVTDGIQIPNGGISMTGDANVAGAVIVAGDFLPGVTGARLEGGTLSLGHTGVGLANVALFQNSNGLVGSIQINGVNTAYNTTSDARLKTDLALPLETDVLARLLVHDFQWTADGTMGRGLFAQEAITVLPAAVTAGCDGPVVDEPWQVDYSKVVPDLIVGWQEHERRIQDLLARLEAVESRDAK